MHRPFQRPVVDAVAGMHCTVVVRIVNHNSIGVHLDRASAAYLGPRTGSVVVARNPDSSRSGGQDAVFGIDRSIRPGGSRQMRIELRFHPEGCNAGGGTISLPHIPIVHVRVLGLPHRRAAREALVFRREGRTRGCRLETVR